jgi:uncharacterized protein YwgA
MSQSRLKDLHQRQGVTTVKPKDVVLLIIDAHGGTLSGRTLLQKVTFFVDDALDLDVGFRAHYFGPFSPRIDAAIGELKNLEFIRETSTGFGIPDSSGFGEMRRYDYALTPDGNTVIEHIKLQEPAGSRRVLDEVQRIREAGNPDYNDLSLAAKIYYILKGHEKPLSLTELRKEAQQVGWNLRQESVEKALDVLKKLDKVRDA